MPHPLVEAWRQWSRLAEPWRMVLEYGAWGLAAIWCVRTRTLLLRLGEVVDLTEVRWDLCPVAAPGLTVVVPARDEAETLGPALETLLAQDYPWLQIVAVDDRSTDGTGALLDARAEAMPDRLLVLHLTEPPEGWMGKTLAMELAVQHSQSAWLLFTDADVWFSPSILRRALAYAEMSGADHLVVAPSPVIRGWGESAVLGFLSIYGLWAARPWRVADPQARWDAVGAGAFNLIRRQALEELGGLAPQRLAVVEDLMLGWRVRAAGLPQRLAFAPGLVLVHWATGARGLIGVMTKNLFALGNFQLWFAGVFALSITVPFLLPLAGLLWWRTLLPAVIVLACVAVQYRTMGEITGISPRAGWGYPLGAVAMLWAMLRSVLVTCGRGGVRWRETFYPLRMLAGWNDPFRWERDAARERAERRRAAQGSRSWLAAKRARKPGRRAPPG